MLFLVDITEGTSDAGYCSVCYCGVVCLLYICLPSVTLVPFAWWLGRVTVRTVNLLSRGPGFDSLSGRCHIYYLSSYYLDK